MPIPGGAHQAGTLWQLQQGAARRALNRTLVLPRFWAWCEMDQVATVLETCTKDGSDQVLPFQTPADYLLNFWALPSSPLKYKEYSFLDNPMVELQPLLQLS